MLMPDYDIHWEIIDTIQNAITVKYTCGTESINVNIPLDDVSQLNDRINSCGPYHHFLRKLNPEVFPDFSSLVGTTGNCVLSGKIFQTRNISNIPKTTP